MNPVTQGRPRLLADAAWCSALLCVYYSMPPLKTQYPVVPKRGRNWAGRSKTGAVRWPRARGFAGDGGKAWRRPCSGLQNTGRGHIVQAIGSGARLQAAIDRAGLPPNRLRRHGGWTPPERSSCRADHVPVLTPEGYTWPIFPLPPIS